MPLLRFCELRLYCDTTKLFVGNEMSLKASIVPSVNASSLSAVLNSLSIVCNQSFVPLVVDSAPIPTFESSVAQCAPVADFVGDWDLSEGSLVSEGDFGPFYDDGLEESGAFGFPID